MLGEINARRTVPREIEDSVVVVTGASSGIGRATARIMAESGARVVFERAVFTSEPVEQGPGNVFEPTRDRIASRTDRARRTPRFGRSPLWTVRPSLGQREYPTSC